MIARLRDWWRLRSLREQRLLGVMAALAGIVFVWLLVIRPLGDRLADARLAHAEAVITAARAEAQAAEILALQRSRPLRSSAPPAVRLAATAEDAGLTLARATPQGDALAVAIEAARPVALFAWIARLEGREGLIVKTLSVRANGDRTLAAQLTVRGRRG